MTSSKLTNLSAITAPTSDDVIYVVDDPGGAKAPRKVTVGNLFLNVPSNGLKVGTSQLVVSGGNIGIGLVSPAALLDIYKIVSSVPTTYNYGVNEYYEMNLAADAGANLFYGEYITLTQSAGNTKKIAGVAGAIYYVKYINADDISSLGAVVILTYPSITSKAVDIISSNRSAASSFVYGCQLAAQNYSTAGATGSTPLLTANRIKLENRAFATGVGNATSTTVNGIDLSILNQGNDGTRLGVVDTARGLNINITNTANATITTSYGVLLNTPSNGGTITNHYGLYIADQTVAGSTLNYSLYVAGGPTYINGTIGFFGHAPAAQPTKAGHNNWAALGDVVQALVDIGILDQV